MNQDTGSVDIEHGDEEFETIGDYHRMAADHFQAAANHHQAAADADAARAVVAECSPDLVIADIRLPTMNGIDLAAGLVDDTVVADLLAPEPDLAFPDRRLSDAVDRLLGGPR